jgi:hypothetical protein
MPGNPVVTLILVGTVDEAAGLEQPTMIVVAPSTHAARTLVRGVKPFRLRRCWSPANCRFDQSGQRNHCYKLLHRMPCAYWDNPARLSRAPIGARELTSLLFEEGP